MDKNKIDQLDQLQSQYNSGRGIAHIRHIVFYLRQNDIESAKTIYSTEGDKTSQYPELQEFLWNLFGCRTHYNKNCQDPICTALRKQWIERIQKENKDVSGNHL